jgi:hypothetical protein
MRILFRKPGPSGVIKAEAGEVCLAPAECAGGRRRAVAESVLRGGSAVLSSDGAVAAECLVLPADPTLDDMLAAVIAERMLTGGAVPDGMARFARYAALVREGLRPTEIPLKSSLEGIYLAILTTAGDDLTDAAIAERFLEGWSRLAATVLRAAEAGKDPLSDPFLENGPDFGRERAFLARDEEVYRQDVARGERWIVSLPDGPPTASGLVLRRPRSILWKFWSRLDRDAPTGDAYLLLGVDWGQGNWVFSTDPVHRMSLKPLAERLDAAERQAGAEPADPAGDDPWFDGKPFDHTLIAAPRRGSRLADAQIMRIVKRWAQVRVIGGGLRRRWIPAAAAVVLLAVIVGILLAGKGRRETGPQDSIAQQAAASISETPGRDRGLRSIEPPTAPVRQGRRVIASVGINVYQHWPILKNAVNDATEISRVLCESFAFESPLERLHDPHRSCTGGGRFGN